MWLVGFHLPEHVLYVHVCGFLRTRKAAHQVKMRPGYMVTIRSSINDLSPPRRCAAPRLGRWRVPFKAHSNTLRQAASKNQDPR